MRGVEELFGSLGELRFADGRSLRPAQLRGVDALLVRSSTPVDAGLLAEHRPRFVGSATAGVDHIDLDLLEREGIGFAFAAGANADAVVDYVFSAVANCGDRLERLLAGERLGIVGFGCVGRRLGARLSALGIDWLACDPWLDQSAERRLVSLERVLECPVVSIHAALTEARPWPSAGMIGTRELGRMSPGALLINAGRGEIVRQRELLAFASDNSAPTLVLDVWENEPDFDPRLLRHCLFGSAHVAGYSYDSKIRAAHILYLALCGHIGVPPSRREPPLAPLPVTVPGSLRGPSLIRWLLGRCYDIREDDRLLRRADIGDFDRLRREYRVRRELGAVHIDNPQELSPAQRRLCEALICGSD